MVNLEELGSSGTVECDGHDLKLTNLDKVLFPGRDGGDPVTKRDLIRYYADIAPVMLPYLEDRAVNLNRFPDGVGTKGFWNKAVPHYAPEWIHRWTNPAAKDGDTEEYYIADNQATLVWLANHAAIELHPWTSPADDIGHPSYALFDIDPGTRTTWEEVLVLARLHRAALEHLGVTAFPKVTGQKGVQIWVPVVAEYSFDDTRTWVETVSKAVGATVPELVSWHWDVKSRDGRARLDFTQNALNKTLVAPYSVRPAAGAPVSAPIDWDELDDPDLRPDRWTIRTIGGRIEAHGDLFAGALTGAQRLPKLG